MKRHKVLALIGSVCLALMLVVPFVVACAAPTPTPTPTPTPSPSPSPSPTPVPTPTEEVYHWKLQHSWSAAESFYFDQYADIVREMSGGRIDIEIFSDGEIVTLMETPEATVMGVLDMMHSHPYNWEDTIPEATIEGLPFLWRTGDEGAAIYHQMGFEDLLKESFEEEFGIYVLGIEPNDRGTMMLTDDFSSLADLKGRRILLWEPYASMLADNFGIISTYVAPEEIYTSLDLGVLDGVQWGGAKCAWDMGFHEVAKYFMLPYFKPSWFPMYAINKELHEGLPADLQAILREAVYANGYYMRTMYTSEEMKCLTDMVTQYGVQVRTLPDEDVELVFQVTLERLEELKGKGPRAKRAAEICFEALKRFGYIK